MFFLSKNCIAYLAGLGECSRVADHSGSHVFGSDDSETFYLTPEDAGDEGRYVLYDDNGNELAF